jgi:hypothetical protein
MEGIKGIKAKNFAPLHYSFVDILEIGIFFSALSPSSPPSL